jgi:hypothetical protein
MAQTPPFEIPQQLRELAERNVEQARTAYGQFMDAMAQASGMWIGALPASEMMSGFKVVQERAVRFAKQNGEACFAGDRPCQRQGYPGRAGDTEPLRADADAGLCPAGAGARSVDERGRAEHAAQELIGAAADAMNDK